MWMERLSTAKRIFWPRWQGAFEAEGLKPPSSDAVLGIVGLSLDVAIPMLAPDADHAPARGWFRATKMPIVGCAVCKGRMFLHRCMRVRARRIEFKRAR